MPNPLDVAFAVLNNAQARVCSPTKSKHGYGPNLLAAHARTEANGEKFWETSLYNLWLGSLRASRPPPGTRRRWRAPRPGAGAC